MLSTLIKSTIIFNIIKLDCDREVGYRHGAHCSERQKLHLDVALAMPSYWKE